MTTSTPEDPTIGQRARRRRARPPSTKSQESEERIFAAAADVFDRKGYAAASIQDVADAAGMVKSSLYYYIDSKQDLLVGITNRIHSLAMRNLERNLATEGSARERMKDFIEGHVLGPGDTPDRIETLSWIRVFYREFRYLDWERLANTMEQRHRYEQHLVDLIVEAQRDGDACPDLDPVLVTTAVLSLLNSVPMWLRNVRASFPEIATSMTHLVMQGITCPADHVHA